ncbi:MAG: LemA family protein [Mailhella sp.]|nr:LemA family protein [Mailhella sp.]
MIIAGIVLAVALVIAVWGIGVYNGLIRLRNLKDEGWSGIDVQLKRRHDLVGNLVNTVKGYMAHEKDVLEEIAKMRSMAQNAAGVAQAAQAEGMLSQALGRLFAVMENYPQLRANENVMQLQNTLTALEDEIQIARRYYNGTVREYKTRTEVFPASIIARQYGFQKADFFELDNVAEREVPQVSF